ncbi:Alg14-domain-containing protein [Sodiomyces alkalinus F11]|uniref:UDP-N-acetylglucosamine transferase subunit ALG14 n=1 Tax=Sodiomyces alkalinus (strain CBS 110278 / VKM F-3762 / F11) TaxID=1314773 RepID=A0A3N2PL46_SODAK|nr:Alg14-domain-containing protein [Sodiomyces alkalinus F11]ROT35219.1 Alg14-domain-containing protein [Sodiomyces alkalinus F11]
MNAFVLDGSVVFQMSPAQGVVWLNILEVLPSGQASAYLTARASLHLQYLPYLYLTYTLPTADFANILGIDFDITCGSNLPARISTDPGFSSATWFPYLVPTAHTSTWFPLTLLLSHRQWKGYMARGTCALLLIMEGKAGRATPALVNIFAFPCALGVGLLVYSSWAAALVLLGSVFWILAAFIFVRHVTILRARQRHPIKLHNLAVQNGFQSRCLRDGYFVIVLGSGGHTKEMLAMMETKFPQGAGLHRRYIVSSGDTMSIKHLNAFEDRMQSAHGNGQAGTFDVHIVTRARRIHQPLWTTPVTALRSVIEIFPLMLESPFDGSRRRQRYPDIIVTNGPATGFIVALVAHLLKIFHVVPEDAMQILFVESWARIKTLSLTGRLFHHTSIADMFLVQHREVAQKYGVDNAGCMVIGHVAR